MFIEAKAAEIGVLIRPESQQIGHLQTAQGAVKCAVLVFAAGTHGIARGHQKVGVAAVQQWNKSTLENPDGIVDIADYGKLEIISVLQTGLQGE